MNLEQVIEMFENAKFKARHGDVVLVRTKENIETDIDMNGVVAEGEATGHAHKVLTGAEVKKVKDEINQMIIRVTKETHLQHEEHDDGPLAKGNYLTGIQKQYGWKSVVD